MNVVRCIPYVLKQVTRHRVRSLLTIVGIAIAMFLFTAVQAMNEGVTKATTATANDTTLVVYREDRYCPATSQLPVDYVRRIGAVDGVVSVTPMRIVVTNCRTSLDVVTFRGVPKESFLEEKGDEIEIVAGSIERWLARSDAMLVGETLANRRNLKPGDTFNAAGIDAYVAGIIRSDDPQDQNVAYGQLAYVQLNGDMTSTDADADGRVTKQLGIVTQFNVKVADASMLDRVADDIDELFARAQEPTATFGEKAFIGRVADDVIELVGFARWLGLGCLAAVLALVANSIVLGVQSRVSEHAVLQTLGYPGRLIAALIVAEGVILSLIGGAIGAAAALLVARYSSIALSVEGTTIPIVADTELLVTGVLVCGAIGVFAGLVPALQASRREIAHCFRAA
jgi:putative ABC transport system permease protein